MTIRLLVVDDEEDFLRSIVMRIELRGIEAHGVTSGTAALEYLKANPDQIDMGTEVEMTLRKVFSDRGLNNYFWKARPIRC